MQISEKKQYINPISKLLIVFFLGMSIWTQGSDTSTLLIVALFSAMYYLYGMTKDAIKNILFYGLILLIVRQENLENLNVVLKMFVSLIVIMKMFYLPFMAGKFFLITSDVSSIITSMDKLKIPMAFSIPISVMFRFFPSFREEHENIKMAMKIRGITLKNPLRYLEYVTIPLLILSSNVTDDIAKSAETKCIAEPAQKVRYRDVRFGLSDLAFIVSIVIVKTVGWL